MASAQKLVPGITVAASGKFRVRYRDAAGKEYAQHFEKIGEAKRWLRKQQAAVDAGTHVDPNAARTTVKQWCEKWLEGYANNRPSTVRQARVHIAHINEAFGSVPIGAVKPSQVKAWTAKLKTAGYADSTIYAVHARLSQITSDAVHDGVIARNPCSRRTSPPMGKQRPYVATTAQVWALHDAMPEHLRPAVLLGAFAGLRIAEVCGLRTRTDVDLMRGVITPQVQYPADPLKSDASRMPVPIPQELALQLAQRAGERWLIEDVFGSQVGPWQIERAVRDVRESVGLPEAFRFHDLRHYFASLLISKGCDVKVVQARLRHASATTTLNTYAHLWPDAEESTRAAVASVFVARADSLRTGAL